MDKKIRVCMVTSSFPPDYGGGAMQALSLCSKLIDKEIELFVVTKNNKGENNIKELVNNIAVYRLGNALEASVKFPFCVKVFLFLLSMRNSFDVVHSHGVYPFALTSIVLSKLLRKKCLVKMTIFGGDDPETIMGRKLGWLQIKILSMADRIISTSSELSESYKKFKLPDKKLVKIANGVDLNKFRPADIKEKISLRTKLGLPIDNIIATFVGLINKRKGIDLLIKAWKIIKKRCPNIKLLLIGPNSKDSTISIDENYISDLRQVIKQYNLENDICFTGQVAITDQYLRASDLFVFPTRGEGLPNALLEAMACGLPCIATKITCIEDIITIGYDGLLFEPEDFEHLSKFVIWLSQNPEIRKNIGLQARATIENKFSMNIIAAQYSTLYRELLQK